MSDAPPSEKRGDYRDTLNLPKTTFPMRADLVKKEPERVAWWKEHRIYEKRLQKNEGAEPYILHDGPPYANGELHMGHFLNRVLKDVLVKIHLLEGKYAKFVPGWDMHGLPIELETLKHLKLDFHKVDPVELREKCRERALYWLGVQRSLIERMGCGFGFYDRPYMTIAKDFEATIVEALAALAERNQIYKGLRSTLWCIHDETALAEAEIEYHDKTSPSIYVRFAANEAQRADLLRRFGAADPALANKPLAVAIWTTTPWTLPANLAIALKADAQYGLYANSDRELIVIAEALAGDVARKAGLDLRKVASVQGASLERAGVRHPFIDRDSLIILADYVELDTGSGAVHTAPGHGADDFESGRAYELGVLSPVNESGRFTSDAAPYTGLQVFDANAKIVDDLRASGALLAAEELVHSYPHCWRCKNPVIFRATAQWFIGMDLNGLRQAVIDAIPAVSWSPAWGENRMTQMIANHPEWCISRQRTWGTPIPALTCNACGEAILDAKVAHFVAGRFRKDGATVWYTDDVATFLPPNFACPKCGSHDLAKEMNIVDIWFESGVTHLAVLGKDGMPWPADAYLEGGDQYRGWFRSNLVTAVAIKGAPPYKRVISYGWVVDSEGRAMHKSAGNYIGAADGMNKYGADVLRLWVASVEKESDVRLGAASLENVSNVYRNLRYRLRYLLSLIDDLIPEEIVNESEMESIDRLALAAVDRMSAQVMHFYQDLNLHDAYLALIAFDDDLSAFYLDALKDRLYTSARRSRRRRSGQSACWAIFRRLAVLMAPILSFTAEEAWQHVPAALRGDLESVFELTLPKGMLGHAASLEAWAAIKRLRSVVAASQSPRNLEARAVVTVPGGMYAALASFGDNLREMLIVSQAELRRDDALTEPAVSLEAAVGEKCARCWKYLPLGNDPTHPALCASCSAIVTGGDSAL